MENNGRDLNRQKVTMAFYSLKDDKIHKLLNLNKIYIGQKYILGRGKECDIDLDSFLLSRRHVELIYYSSNLIQIKDLNSRNGTYINNTKAEPNQEIKFSEKDKLSLGDTENKMIFLEEEKAEKPINKAPVNQNMETTPINNTNNTNYVRRNRRYYNQNRVRVTRSQPQNRDNNDIYISKLIRQLKGGNNTGNFIRYRKRFTPYRRFTQKGPFSFTQINQNKEKENQNVFVGRKTERNNTNMKENDDNIFKGKKEGLEKLKKKLKSVDVNEDDEDEEEEEEGESLGEEDIIDIDDEKGNKNEKIILKTNKLNKLEFTLPLKGKNLKKLKEVKKVKCLVSGYVVLNVKKKKLIYE